MSAADREWTRDVATSIARWLAAFAGAGLLVELLEQPSWRDALAGLPSRCASVLPLAAALGAGLAFRAWTADGRLVAVTGIGRSPARLALCAGLVGAAAATALLGLWELAPPLRSAGGAWASLPAEDGAQLWLRGPGDAAWLRDGALVAAGRGGSTFVIASGALVPDARPLPAPEVWLAATRPGPEIPLSRLIAAPSGQARDAWMLARLLGVVLSGAAAVLGASASAHLGSVAFGCAFASVLHTTAVLAVTQGRLGHGALLVVPVFAVASAVAALLALDRRPG